MAWCAPFHSLFANSFAPDSTLPVIPTRVSVYTEQSWNSGETSATLDTGFNELNLPDPVIREGGQHLGVIGSPSKNTWTHSRNSMYSWAGYTAQDPWLIRPEQVEYFRTNKRLTRLNYHMASFKEQLIEAFHTQNILKSWNAGIKFTRFNVKDFLPRSDTYFNRFLFFTDYASKNGRYHLFANAVWNSFNNQLNGGITTDTLFIGTEVSNRDMRGLPVRLSAADNRTKEKSFHASHYFRIDRPSDSSRFNTRLFLSSTYTAGSSTYFDDEPDSSSLYQNYFNGTVSYDSTGFQDFRNKAGLELAFKSGKSAIAIIPYLEHQLFNYGQDTSIEQTNTTTGGDVVMSIGNFGLSAGIARVLDGGNNGNGLARIDASYRSGNWKFSAGYSHIQAAVPLLYQRYESNHFRWSNSFDPIIADRLSIAIRNDRMKFSLLGELERTDGMVFMARNATPDQFPGVVEIRRISLSKDFTWRKWHWDNRIRLQQTDNDSIVRLPAVNLVHSLYWERDLLKKAFILTAGVRFRYQSGYKGDAFMPGTGFFYLQDSTVTFGQPVFDFFTDFRIKGATVYLALENMLQSVLSESYYMTPTYPQASRVFRFGVRWFFLDQ